jgi:hypothetical protein
MECHAGKAAYVYREVEVKVLTEEAATKDAPLDALEWLERRTAGGDVRHDWRAVFDAGREDSETSKDGRLVATVPRTGGEAFGNALPSPGRPPSRERPRSC